MVCGTKNRVKYGHLDHSEDGEQQSQYTSARGSRFGARRLKRRSNSHQQLLLMDCVGKGGGGGGNGDGASEETVPLPEYKLLSQSARLPDVPDPALKNPPPPTEQQVEKVKQRASPPQPQQQQQQKPAAWRLIEYVRSRHKSGGAAGGCGSSDGDSKSSDGEEEGEVDSSDERSKEKKDKKKRSSWLPDPDRRWPVQGFY